MVSGPYEDACSRSVEEKERNQMEGKSHGRRNGVTAKVSEPIDPFPLTVLAFTDRQWLHGPLSSASLLLFHPSRAGAGDGWTEEERRCVSSGWFLVLLLSRKGHRRSKKKKKKDFVDWVDALS